MIELPDYLEGGDEARLIPASAGTQRESFACSVLLASLRVVRPFAREFFGHMNWKVGSWAEIRGYTEPVFRQSARGNELPTRRAPHSRYREEERRAIVETKIGLAKIDLDQLVQYCRLAKAKKIEAIITVSNELSADPTHLPYDVPKEIKNIPIFHWSWSYLVMLAELLLREEEDFDEEQDYILREIIRYFDHESAGVSCNTNMCPEWSDNHRSHPEGSCGSAQTTSLCSNVVQCWHQQLASVCISQTRQLKFPVTLLLSRKSLGPRCAAGGRRCGVCGEQQTIGVFGFPTPAGPVELIADARRRNITCRLPVDAPLN